MGEYFTMIMQLEFDDAHISIATIQEVMQSVAQAQKLVIRVQLEDLFDAMNRL